MAPPPSTGETFPLRILAVVIKFLTGFFWIRPAAYPALQLGSLVGEDNGAAHPSQKTQPLNSKSGAADETPSVGFTWKREGAAGKPRCDRYRTNEALGLVLCLGRLARQHFCAPAIWFRVYHPYLGVGLAAVNDTLGGATAYSNVPCTEYPYRRIASSGVELGLEAITGPHPTDAQPMEWGPVLDDVGQRVGVNSVEHTPVSKDRGTGMTAAACLPHGMLCRHMGSHRRQEERGIGCSGCGIQGELALTESGSPCRCRRGCESQTSDLDGACVEPPPLRNPETCTSACLCC